MNLDDKIAEWKRQIEQAIEYDLYFDVVIVKEMVDELENLKNEYEKLKDFIEETSVETVEKKLEPYYEEMMKFYQE